MDTAEQRIINNHISEEKIDGWDDLINIFREYGFSDDHVEKPWMFRGERDYESPLKTSLERAIYELGEEKRT